MISTSNALLVIAPAVFILAVVIVGEQILKIRDKLRGRGES